MVWGDQRNLCKSDWITGCPGNWLNIILGMFMRVFLDEIDICISRLHSGDCPLQCVCLIQSIEGLYRTKRLSKGEFVLCALLSWSWHISLLPQTQNTLATYTVKFFRPLNLDGNTPSALIGL